MADKQQPILILPEGASRMMGRNAQRINILAAKAVSEVPVPAGFAVSEQGEMRQMKESFGRLGKALILSMLFLYLSFVVIFRSFSDPVVIMLSIPFAFIGAVWALLLMGRHACMPAMMGLILLTGVIVNNSILLIDFIRIYRREGHPLVEAVKMAIRVRTRPILMTAVTTIVGMLPIAAEWAIGLERLSPLATVAIGGLIVGTFLTLVYIPVLYILKEKIRGFFTYLPIIAVERTEQYLQSYFITLARALFEYSPRLFERQLGE